MGEAHLAQQGDLRLAVRPALAMADGERCPFADPVRGQDRRPPRRRGQEGGCRVRLVVLGEQHLAARNPQV